MPKTQSRQEAHFLFETRELDFLEEARREAKKLAQSQGIVTAEDVRAKVAIPPGCHPSIMGSVFRSREWEAVGFSVAHRSAARGRIIRQWRLK